MKKNAVVIVGAGSTHTPGIIQSLLQKKDEFPLRKLALFDIDEKRLHLVYDIMKQFINETYPGLEVVVTTNEEEAYTDIDFVFAQIRQGGLKLRSSDEKIPLKYGVVGQETCGPGGSISYGMRSIPAIIHIINRQGGLKLRSSDEKIPLKYGVVGQETCGPGGSISYGMRSIPAIIHIIKMAKKYSPNCWILNYSNPAAVVAEATRREFNNERILNICDMPTAILLSYSKMLGLDSWQSLDPCYFGLNHFGWFTALYDKEGKDRLPELREMILTSGMTACSDKHHKDKDWQKTWKQYAEIVKDYPDFLPNSYLPNCWILNYSNPAAVVAEATRREFNNERILNICDMPTAILLSYSKMLGLDSWQSLDPCYFGLNHFGWFTALYDKEGKDRLPELREMILTSGMTACSDKHHKDKDWQKTWKQYAEIVKDYPDFLPNSYLQYYLYSSEMVAKMDINRTRADMVIEGREQEMFAEHKKYLESPESYKSPLQEFTVFGDFIVDAASSIAYNKGERREQEMFAEHKKYLESPESYKSPLQEFTVFGDFIVDAASSIAYNKGERFLVIVENNGAIPNMPADAMVEVPAYIRSWGPEPVSIPAIPTFHKGMMENQLASEKLAVDAYFENSYDKALQAIAINKTVPSTTVARKILNDLIEANGDYWPTLK